MAPVYHKAVIGLSATVGLSLLAYTVWWFATPRAVGENAHLIRHGMTKREVLDLMPYPPGRYGLPFQRHRDYAGTQPTRPGTPSWVYHRWEGTDVRVVVGYDEHGRVNNVWIDPAR